MQHRSIYAILFLFLTFASPTFAQVHNSPSGTSIPSTGGNSSAPAQARAVGYNKLVFSDEFNAPRISPTGTGSYDWYQGEWWIWLPDFMTRMPVQNSYISLQFTPGQTGLSTGIATDAKDQSQGRFFNQGYFEARMRWTTKRGAWPSFWLYSSEVPRGTDNDRWCEIDIFEGQGAHPTTFFGHVHDWIESGGVVRDTVNANAVQALNPSIDLSDWHTYGLLWANGNLTWYLNNVPLMTAPSPAICESQQLFLILAITGGVDWTIGNFNGVTAPMFKNDVDWVRVWQR
jgi:hypothetical protein